MTFRTHGFPRIVPAVRGGAWLIGVTPPVRLLGGRGMPFETADTPLKDCRILDIKEDAEGGLWFLIDPGRLMHFRRSGPALTLASPPAECGRELTVAAFLGGTPISETVNLFARVDGGAWSAVEGTPGSCTFRMPSNGRHRCEVMAYLPGTSIESPPPFEVTARMVLPNTLLATEDDEPFLVETYSWSPPVKIAASGENRSWTLSWRDEGGAWKDASGAPPVLSMHGIEPGLQGIEVRAVEQGTWSDPTPLSMTIRFAPDPEKVVARAVEDLCSGEPRRIDRARKDILEQERERRKR